MSHISRILPSFLLISLAMLLSTGVSAMETLDHSSSIFKFQQKLADKGNAQAQYKLAAMYEAGVGVESDIEQAKRWYEQASKAGIKAASDRSIYLTVKQQGYQQSSHSGWLKSVKADAGNRKVDAKLLLAQLYRDGIGVKKDLNKSLELFIQVGTTGDANVENEITSIENEIKANKVIARQKRVAKKQASRSQVSSRANSVKKSQAVKKDRAKVVPVKVVARQPRQQVQEVSAEEKERLIKAEKRRKYEMVMKQIQLEQQKIDELQKQVSGGEVASVDDEI